MRTKRFFSAAWSLLFLIPAIINAENAYITDTFKVTLRRGPSLDHKILKFVDSGQPVTVFEEQEGWNRVTVIGGPEDGLEGWVLTRYLINRLPWEVQAKTLQAENSLMKNELLLLKETMRQESEKKVQLEEAHKHNQEALERVRKEYATLKQESQEFIQLKSQYETTKNNEERLAFELKQLEESTRNKWFALGALVILFGMIIGLQIGKLGKRGRSGLSL